MLKLIKTYILDSIAIFYPAFCFACGELLFRGENVVCTNCIVGFPRTNFHRFANNKMEKQFWGKVMVEAAFAFFYFQKRGRIQRLLHTLKYKKNPEIGEKLGSLYAAELMAENKLHSIDYIIAIPLHKKKMKVRGYNQSLCFAEGISKQLNKPILRNCLRRVKNNATQTKKSRFERFKNVATVFKVRKASELKNKHLLLVDDVMTTGSTLAACVQLFNKIEGCKVTIATIAYAE